MTSAPVDLTGLGAVVTGAGGGIGAALATALAGAGARVVVNDLHATAAEEVASRIGGYAFPGDCASEAGVAALVEAAEAHLGHIDIWVGNAGVEDGVGIGDEASWARAHEVNVLAHVRAARLLVPGWVASGGGRFVVTASAAGLLTMLGSAPYGATKHAAVAFAEFLSATYGDQGVIVQAICPQGVRTRMYDQAGPMQPLLALDGTLEPDEVAATFLESLADDRFLILPHPQVADYYAARAADTDRWLRGARRAQARMSAATKEA